MMAILSGALFASVVGYLLADQIAEHQSFDAARSSLGVTRERTATVKVDLAVLRHDLAVLTSQVNSDSTTWNQDEAQLKAASTALAITQGTVSQQSSLIGPLHTCLGGVQQALNALAIDNQSGAIGALNAVSASCAAAGGG